MPYYCTVPRCTSMAGKAKNVSFHQFPRDEELARLWNDVLKRGKPYTKYSKVCSLHFKPEDYTITSVGKNKGQWRTLRKDAVPSQNLPSETPLPYSRKQWDNWSQTSTTNVIDPTVQVAQAIYMQTMMAMQAAGTTDPSMLHNGPLPELPHTSNEDKNTSYKCTECTKCFKDPDVFLLHKRSHTKDNGTEKENFNMNVTLRSNPILANLLKTNHENNFDPNMVTMENLLMTALAANMDYIRNFSMVKDSDREYENDRSDFSHDRNDMTHSKGDLTHSRTDLTNSRTDLIHTRSDLTHSRSDSGQSDLRHGRSDSSNGRSDLSHVRSDLSHVRSDLSHSRSTSHGRTDIHNAISDLSRLRSELNHSSSDSNNRRDLDPERDGNVIGKLKFSKDLSISVIERNFNDNGLKKGGILHQSDDLNAKDSKFHAKNNPDHHKSDASLDRSDSNHYSNDQDTPTFETDSSSKNNVNYNGFYKETYYSTENNDSTDNNDIENNGNGIDRPNCDNDFNESMDSSDLVIDES